MPCWPGRCRMWQLSRADRNAQDKLSLLSAWATGWSLSPVRAHDLDRLVGRYSCFQQLAGGPALFFDEVRDEQPVARVTPISLHRGDIDRMVAESVPKFLERLPVLDAYIVGEPFPYPLGHEKASEADVLSRDDMGEFVGT